MMKAEEGTGCSFAQKVAFFESAFSGRLKIAQQFTAGIRGVDPQSP
jgi:hypothetical protein